MSDPRFDATPYAVLASLRCAGVTLTHRYDSTTKRFHATASQGDVQPGEGSAATLRDAALDAVHSLACSHDRGEQENRAILGELAADRAPAERAAPVEKRVEHHRKQAVRVRSAWRCAAATWLTDATMAEEVSL